MLSMEHGLRVVRPRHWLSLERTPFARVQSPDAELRQLALLRWATGIVCFARTVPIVYGSIDYIGAPSSGGLPELTIAGLWTLAFVAVATAGIAAPLTLPLMMYEYQAYDLRMQTETLGTDVLMLLLALFWLSGAGSRLSVDAFWLRRGTWSGAPIRALYRLTGIPPADELRRIYFLFFVAYGLLSFGAVIFHIDDPAWRSGSLMRMIFTSSYLSRLWGPFRELESQWPMALQAFSIVGTLGQVVFQLFMIPLVWTRWGTRFVVTWGILFFAASLAILQLSYLPVLEILLWIALFWRPRAHAVASGERYRPFTRSRLAGRGVVIAGSSVLIVFALIGLPYMDDLWGPEVEPVRRGLQAFGLEVPVVLNRDDLRMGDAWPVIYRRDQERDVLLPYHGLEGERLAWVQWNDLFYFGNSLKWRREFRGSESMDRASDSFSRLVDVALFDHRHRGAARSEYVFVYFATDGSNADADVGRRFERRHLGTDWVACSGVGESAKCE